MQAWTSGKDAQLQADDYSGANLATVSALLKKHQAFQSDLTAHEQRVHEIGTLANELDDLKYVNADAVNDRYAVRCAALCSCACVCARYMRRGVAYAARSSVQCLVAGLSDLLRRAYQRSASRFCSYALYRAKS